jgi:glycosyltransferase involved in cell wall biosynthesis
MKAITVITPVHNASRFLPSIARHLEAQASEDLEFLFVDDGSTDDTLARLEELAETNHSVTILSQKNAGTGVARNTGIEQASGEFVAFLDVDDRYCSGNSLEHLYEAAKSHDALVCMGSVEWRCRGTVAVPRSRWDKTSAFDDDSLRDLSSSSSIADDPYMYFSENGMIEYRDYQYDLGFWRCIFKRELLMDGAIRFPPWVRYEDPVFFVRALVAAGSFYAISEPVYSYNVGWHPTPVSERFCSETLAGIRENLIISRDHNLSLLHWITAARRFRQLRDIDLILSPDTENLVDEFERTWALVDSSMIMQYGVLDVPEPLLQCRAFARDDEGWKSGAARRRLRRSRLVAVRAMKSSLMWRGMESRALSESDRPAT